MIFIGLQASGKTMFDLRRFFRTNRFESHPAIVTKRQSRLAGHYGQARADLVIRVEQAAIRTEDGPNAGGGWNFWSNGQVGQPLRFATAGTYAMVVRAWGTPAAGIWPEMALLVDGKVGQTATVGRRTPEDHRFDVELPPLS